MRCRSALYRVAFLLMLARGCLVVIECLLVDCFPVLIAFVCSRVTVGDVASVRSTSPSASSSHQVRGSIYHAYNFQLTVPSSRIERLLDPTTYIYAYHMKTPNSHVPPHPSKPCTAMLPCSLLSPCVVCMLGLYPLLYCYSSDWAITLLLYCCG